jgi:2-hydroxychromene-2-carboxylate isomerase
VDFWFSIGSTYSYLSVMRLPEVESRTGVPFRWCPFNVRDIMVEMKNIPFSTKPVKAAYMWRDIERRAAMYGLPFEGVPPYPIHDLARVNRLAAMAAEQGWCADLAQATYRYWYQKRQDPSTDEALSEIAANLGRDPEQLMAMAQSDDGGRQLELRTAQARALGIFGAPTWAVGRELFWGDDRLDDAIAWQRRGTLSGARTP